MNTGVCRGLNIKVKQHTYDRDRFSLEDFRLDWSGLNSRHGYRNFEESILVSDTNNFGLEMAYTRIQQLAILLEIAINDINNYRSAR